LQLLVESAHAHRATRQVSRLLRVRVRVRARVRARARARGRATVIGLGAKA